MPKKKLQEESKPVPLEELQKKLDSMYVDLDILDRQISEKMDERRRLIEKIDSLQEEFEVGFHALIKQAPKGTQWSRTMIVPDNKVPAAERGSPSIAKRGGNE